MRDNGLRDGEIAGALELFNHAREYAKRNGHDKFACPLCGGEAWWNRSKLTNHLHSGCESCGFLVIQ